MKSDLSIYIRFLARRILLMGGSFEDLNELLKTESSREYDYTVTYHNIMMRINEKRIRKDNPIMKSMSFDKNGQVMLSCNIEPDKALSMYVWYLGGNILLDGGSLNELHELLETEDRTETGYDKTYNAIIKRLNNDQLEEDNTMKREFKPDTRILYYCRPKNGIRHTIIEVSVGQLFNFDAFMMDLTEKELEFLNSCSENEWTDIPKNIADPTNYKNFVEKVKLLPLEKTK